MTRIKSSEIIDRVFGRLTVKDVDGLFLLSVCSCGNPDRVRCHRSNVISGRTRSCGCLQKEYAESKRKPKPARIRPRWERRLVDEPGVRWAAAPGWPEYEVSDDGRVRCVVARNGYEAGRELAPQRHKYGHTQVSLCSNGVEKKVSLHKLMWEAFNGPVPHGLLVCHDDGKASNNRLSNFRLDTTQGNVDDRRRHGTNANGERNAAHVLTEEQVREIARESRKRRGQRGYRVDLAARYGVTVHCISDIASGRSWAHLAEEAA